MSSSNFAPEFRARLATVIVLGSPGEKMPPASTVTAPALPSPPKVAPLSTVTVELAIEPFTIRVPPATVVAPV